MANKWLSVLSLVGLGSSSGSLSTKTTGPPGGNETNLLPWWSIPADGTGVTNVLVVTTTMRMLNGVHSNTTNLGPTVPLHTVLVVCVSSLEKGLLSTTSPGNLTDHSTASTRDNLLGTRWQLDPSSIIIRVVTDDNSIIPRSSCKNTTITNMVLNITNHSSFRDGSKGKNIAHHEISLLTTEDELPSVHTLSSNEELLLVLVPEGVTEGDASKWGPTTWVVDNLGDNTLQVPIAFTEV